ncbi:PAS domain-containing protein, partial [candidate division WWE3 bacterium]|nr:PAS domain-containing protein [candidate division WWE3 bacterium]
KDLGLSSSMIIPLNVRGKTVGAITFSYADSHYQYNNRDLEMAIILGLRASLAIENSMLYDEIELERQRLDDIVQNVPGVVWEWWLEQEQDDAHQNYASAYVEKLLGYTQEDWKNSTSLWKKIIYPDDLNKTIKSFKKIYHSKSNGSLTFRCVKKNNQVIWVEAHCMAILDETNKPIGLRGVIFDISERAEMEDRKTEFISLASHELKTPLSSLVVYIKLLEQQLTKEGNPKYSKYINRIARQTKNLTNLVNDLLDISRIETGKMQLSLQKTTMSEIVQEIVDTLQETSETHTIVVKGESNTAIDIDAERISQVILNLLSNAIKYSPEADKVIVRIYEEDDHVKVSVQDFGIGIEKDAQPLIFNRFYRGTNESGKNFSGLGIGLYISHDIVQKHNGTLALESTPGKGSTFTFSLPL